MANTPGMLFRQALREEKPLQITGTINAYSAMMAQQVGYKAIYISGGALAAASFGLPDLGITTLNDVLEDARRITRVVDLPLLVDIDTGFGSAFNIARTITEMINAGVAAVHMEDQVAAKRCGHRPGKALVSQEEMVDRLKIAVDARNNACPDKSFVIMARTDALASEGIKLAIERAQAYVEAGADMIFAEAVTELEQYRQFAEAVKVPILANITEFGKTPLFTVEELRSVDVSMILYPLTAFRAMCQTALNVYQTVRDQGSQKSVIESMQTREELYQFLNYHRYEQTLDQILEREKKNDE